jgi:Uma2 family endonuclease
MTGLHKPHLLGFEAYLAGELRSPVRHEYLAGQVYAMAGAGERHNRIALNLAFKLRRTARGGPCGVFIADMKVRVDAHDVCYYPDVMVICDPADDDEYVKRRPCLIAEVLSPTTEATDRPEKWLAYRDLPSLRYYLLVGSDRRQIELYARNALNEWETAELETGGTLEIQCGDYSSALSLEQTYEDVTLPR